MPLVEKQEAPQVIHCDACAQDCSNWSQRVWGGKRICSSCACEYSAVILAPRAYGPDDPTMDPAEVTAATAEWLKARKARAA